MARKQQKKRTSDPSLPVVANGSRSPIRKSATSKWRAAALILLHVLIAVHVTHFLVAGETVSPVEPSESMYTLELGQVNAGFIFFVVALLLTLVFGRFLCGWACHLVALQDLCGWLMTRLGVKPRPFRSRLLLWVPFGLAVYMFVWPAVKRLALLPLLESTLPGVASWLGPMAEFPGFTNHLVTDGFWETFPGPWIAVLTFATCGFAAVYFLGSKGFCTYGCPYGGFFAVVDRFSPGRIVVSDACEQCGHCTATCTSNVLVHEEVRRYGMVVDPGCMKCMDCVSVCPKHALSFSFARPAAIKGAPRDDRAARRFDLPLAQEIMLLAVFFVGVLAFRRLYDGPPLLMSVCLGGLTAWLVLRSWHLLRRGTVKLQNLTLKAGGTLGPSGYVFSGFAVLWLLFTGHSLFMQSHRTLGASHLERTEAPQSVVLSGGYREQDYSERHRRAADASFRHFRTADRYGLFPVAEVKLGLTWGHLLRGETGPAVERLREAIEINPLNAAHHGALAQILTRAGRFDEAFEARRRQFELGGGDSAARFQYAILLAERERFEEAEEQLRQVIDLGGDSAEVRYNLGGLLRRMDRLDEAVAELQRAREMAPGDYDTHVELGLAELARGDGRAAVRLLQEAMRIDPYRPESQSFLPQLVQQIEAELAAASGGAG